MYNTRSQWDLLGGVVLLATGLLYLSLVLQAGGATQEEADPSSADTDAGPTAFIDVNVVPMDRNRIIPHQTVVVEEGVIAWLGPNEEAHVPDGVRRIEGDGDAYLMPGLTDAHVHLDLDAHDWVSLFLVNGVTTVFNLRGDAEHLRLRDEIRGGGLLGPTVLTSGPFTKQPLIKTPTDAERAVREQKEAGYDFVKVHGNLNADAYRALTEAGLAAGIAIIGHAPRNLPFDAVLESGQAMVAHAEELIYTHFTGLDPSRIDELAPRMGQARMWLVPTLSMFHNIVGQWGTRTGLDDGLRRPEREYLPAGIRRYWTAQNPYTGRNPGGVTRIQAMYDFQLPLIAALNEAGVRLLSGTDTPLPVMYPGFSLHEELDELVLAGLTPFDALATGTRNAGKFIAEHVSEDDPFGTIGVGQRADLLLLSANPLDDVEHARTPRGVMVRGVWLDRAALDQLLARAARLASATPPG